MNNFGKGVHTAGEVEERLPMEDVMAPPGLGYGSANAAVSNPPRKAYTYWRLKVAVSMKGDIRADGIRRGK